MKTFKRVVIALVALAILAIIAAVLAGRAWLNSMARTGIEKGGPELTGTAVTVDEVDLSPWSGAGSLSSLVIGNPAGFGTDGALKIGQARIALQGRTLLEDTVVIDEIVIDGAELTYELSGRGSNIARIRTHVESVLEKIPAGGTGGETKVIIGRFLLTAASLRLSATILKGNAKTVPMPEIELKDIGRKTKGVTAAEAAGQILDAVFRRAAETAATSGLPVPGDELKERAENLKKTVTDKIRGIFDR